jgi:hypothetical protein
LERAPDRQAAEAQWSAKGQGKHKRDWVGYKVQVAETVGSQEDASSFITSVVTQRATESDDAGLPATLQKQQSLGLEAPRELYADGAYISAKAIHEAKEAGWELVGPAQRRIEQQSREFRLRMHQRNAIEGTISELVRGHGLRRARYRGLAKVDQQNQLVAAACNIKRWFQKLQGTIFAAPREDAALSGGSLRKVLANYFVQIDPRSFWAKQLPQTARLRPNFYRASRLWSDSLTRI